MRIWRQVFNTYRSTGRFLPGVTGRTETQQKYKQNVNKYYCTCPAGMKVTICGAAGCTGQPLALLLKQSPQIDELALYDPRYTCGFGLELSHVDTKCRIASYSGRHMLAQALQGSKVVIIVARNQSDTFKLNSPVVMEIALQICNACPGCFTIVATEPIESLVALVGEVQRLRGMYDPRKLLGCVELNCVRANTVLADFLRVPPETVRVPVIGGATTCTMVPVLSTSIYPGSLTQEQVECVTSCIMSSNEMVCAAKGCSGATACLAGAFAIARTAINVIKGLQGSKVQQCAYVDSLGTCAPCCQFFSSEVILGPSGVEKNLGIPELSKFENCLLYNCLPYIRNEIARAVWLVYSICTQAPCTSNSFPHPSAAYTPCVRPCVPPTNWTGDWPDSCRDEYLASICRDMTCTCGSTELKWRPRESDYDAARAANLTHQILDKTSSCEVNRVPRSIRMQREILKRANDSGHCG